MKQLKLFSLFLLANLISSTMAFAGASITVVYQPLTGVPTLSGSMLIVLVILLAAVAFRMFKQPQSGTTMLLGVLGVAALMSGVGGVKLLSDANAVAAIGLPSPAGGSVTIQANSINIFQNTSGVTLRITDLSTNNPQFCTELHTDYGLTPAGPHCSIDSTIQPTAPFCYVACEPLPSS